LDCDDFNQCTADTCDPLTYICRNVPSSSCNDNNGCTADACDPQNGCVHIDQSARCDDNNACTTDSCVPATGNCNNVNVTICSALDTPCLYGFCYPLAAQANDSCRTGPIECFRKDNCTIVECVTDEIMTSTDTGLDVNFTGCKNTTLNCFTGLLAVIAGLVGGALAGVIIDAAAVVAAGAAATGGAYAISSNYLATSENSVSDNPLYKQQGKCQEVDLGL